MEQAMLAEIDSWETDSEWERIFTPTTDSEIDDGVLP
jgi:hypothetical protein